MKAGIIFKLFAFCIMLLLTRLIETHHFTFSFLLWNLFLAWLPYGIVNQYGRAKKRSGRVFIMAAALLFLPNAPYIITDLFHLTKNLAAPMWYDLVLILSFSLLGLIFFIMTAERLFAIIAPFFKSDTHFKMIKFTVLLSNGYGIYLGRYLRLNSWDLLSSPGDLFEGVFNSVFKISNCKETLAITFTFAIFLYLVFEIYESFKKRVEREQYELH